MEDTFNLHRIDGSDFTSPDVFKVLTGPPLPKPQSLSEQWQQLMLWSNLPDWDDGHPGYKTLLSVVKPGEHKAPFSLRNRLLFLFRKKEVVEMCVLASRYMTRMYKVTPKPLPSLSSNSRCNLTDKKNPTRATLYELTGNISDPLENQASLPTLYTLFSQGIIENDLFFWRIHDSQRDVFVFGDINVHTGLLATHQYAQVIRILEHNQASFTCDCRVQGFLLPSEGQNCCHIRFCNDYVEPVYNGLTSLPPGKPEVDSRVNALLWKNIGLRNNGVVHLATTSKSSSLYSALPHGTTGFPSIVSLSEGIITCKAGTCDAHHRCRRKVSYLDDAEGLCPHLQTMRAYMEVWDAHPGNSNDASETSASANREVHIFYIFFYILQCTGKISYVL